jgi:hypothetical protein
MRFIVFVRATKDSEAGVMPSQKLITEMGNFNEEMVNAGIMLAADGLHPSSKGARIRFDGAKRDVIDGPFPEKEVVAGYWIIEVKSLAEAIEWIRRAPNPFEGGTSEIEIRPIFGAEDFGAEFTPEAREQEARMQATIDSRKKN